MKSKSEPLGHKNAKKRLEKKQNSLNALLSDEEKVILLKLTGKYPFDHTKQQLLSSNQNERLKKEDVVTENEKKSLIDLFSDKDIQNVMALCKAKEKSQRKRKNT